MTHRRGVRQVRTSFWVFIITRGLSNISYGILSLLPVCLVITLAIMTKRALEPLIIGSMFGFLLIAGPVHFFSEWMNALYEVMAEPDKVWLILLCGLLGSFVALLEKSGGVMSFSMIMDRLAKNRQTALLITWLLGIFLFIDNYLNVMAVGSAMRRTTDKFRIPREFLAYTINSAGAAICVLVPFSTWSAFMFGELQTVGVIKSGVGISAYLGVVPFLFYAWASILFVPLYSYKMLPRFGAMGKREKYAEATGQTLPDGIIHETDTPVPPKANAVNFILPVLVLCVVPMLCNDILLGVIAGILTCLVLSLLQGSFKGSGDAVIEGFKDMIMVLGIVTAAFVFQKANNALDLTNYVIFNVTPFLNASFFPVIIFILISVLAFGTGSFWGIAAIAFPIIIPLARTLNAHEFLVCGAIISGTVFGSHSCFFGDAVTLSCASSEIRNNDYVRCVLPLLIIPFMTCVLMFLVFGFLL